MVKKVLLNQKSKELNSNSKNNLEKKGESRGSPVLSAAMNQNTKANRTKSFIILLTSSAVILTILPFFDQIHKKTRYRITDLKDNLTYRRIGSSEWKKFSNQEYIRTDKNENTMKMKIQLPDFSEGQNAIYLETIDMGARFFLDGRQFYSHGEWNAKDQIEHFPNFFAHIVLLPPEASAKTIDVDLYSDWKSIGIYDHILLGNERDLWEILILKQVPNFAFSLFYMIVGISAVLMFWMAKDSLLLYFGFSSISLSIICLAEVDINLTEYLWHETSAFLGLNGYFGMVYFFTKFIGEIFGKSTKLIMKYYSYVVILTYFYGLFIISTYGFTRGYCDYFELVGGIASGVGATLTVASCFYHAILKEKNARILLFGLLVFFTTFYRYLFFQFGWSTDNASDVHLRFFPVMMSLVWIISLRYRENILRLQEYTHLLEESKLNLEEKIKEKTIGLEIANLHLTNANRSKNEFFANVSHEFKTPLTLILSPLERLSGKTNDEQSLFLLSVIHRNATRIQALVDDLLAIAKIEFGVIAKEKINVELISYFRKISEEFEILCDDKNIQFHLHESAQPLFFRIDKYQWDLILRNLLSNAVKFTPTGQVDLAYEVLENKIKINISDTGIGIAPDETHLVFEKFYQSSRGKAISSLGTGIGLYLVKEMVNDCEGSFVISSAENVGTKVELDLPLYPATEATQAETLFPRIRRAKFSNVLDRKDLKHRLLIVEDEPSMSDYLYHILKEKYMIKHVTTVDEAVACIENLEFDLILSDWTLPGKNGIVLLEQVKHKNKNLPFLFLTARTENYIIETAFQLGADDFIAKPFNVDDLLLRIEQKINKSKEHKQDIINEKDSIYGDIHDILGGKLTDLVSQINQLDFHPELIPERLANIRHTATTLSNELRTKLHEWEDFRNIERDFELGWMSMLLRRYSNAGRICRVKLKEGTIEWKEAERWSLSTKTEIFRITQEIANNDLKYGSGPVSYEIGSLLPSFELKILTKSHYQKDRIHGRGSRNLAERCQKLGASLQYLELEGEFNVLLFIPNTLV